MNMKMVLTDTCFEQLSKMHIPDPKCVRLSAEYEGGGCGCTLAVQMRLDERTADDVYTATKGIPFIIDKTSQMLLGDEGFELDFRNISGYVLKTPNETLAYGIQFER